MKIDTSAPVKTVLSRQLDKSDLKMLRRRSKKVLLQLITERGIYASTGRGWRGAYHAWFGRDSAITAGLVFQAEKLGHRKRLAKKTYRALQQFAHWQGSKDNPETGEELGKFPHEIRDKFSKVNEFQHAAATNSKPWFIDSDGLLKNWDTCDSTPLWIIAIARGNRYYGRKFSHETLLQLKLALRWCLQNIEKNGGLAGFYAAELQPGRLYSGLHNQGWKDTVQIYQYADGQLATHPIKDVLINAETWAALKYGAEIFAKRDKIFAQQLEEQAQALKKRFNNPETGFLITDTAEGPFYAEAIDGKNQKLPSVAADVGMCLWAYYDDECVIDKKYLSSVVARIMMPDMFNPNAGVRDYSLNSTFIQGTSYHGSPYTYWPFVSGLIAAGLDHFGYKKESAQVAEAMLAGVSNFDTCIELFVETKNGRYHPWHHPKLDQQSAANQAWSAAGIYYAARYLQKQR